MNTLSTLPAQDVLRTMNPSAPPAASAQATQVAQDRFMTLLVTQMKNQDPLNPLDNAQVTSQLAQLSTVTGIDKLNGTMQALMASVQASQSLQAAGMIGRSVLVPGDGITLAGGNAAFGVELSGPADALQISISDAAGNLVRTIQGGPQPAGTSTLAWDGQTNSGVAAPDGTYHLEISALRGGQKVDGHPLSFAAVNSLSMSAQGVQLNLGHALPPVTMTDVRQIR
jgi:flagellar basal-body rod modification protein FlgD